MRTNRSIMAAKIPSF